MENNTNELKTPMKRLSHVVYNWYTNATRILIYSAIQLLMVGLLFGGAYLTFITILEDLYVCITLTLGITMFLLGGVLIHTWIRDVIRE